MQIQFGLIALVLLAADETKKDEDRIQGTWTAVSVVAEGEAYPADKAQTMAIVFKADTMVLLVDGKEEEKYTFKLEPTKEPKTIDFAEKKGEPVLGIYELEGDALKLCWNKEDKAKGRPDKFAATAENKWSMITLKRKDK